MLQTVIERYRKSIFDNVPNWFVVSIRVAEVSLEYLTQPIEVTLYRVCKPVILFKLCKLILEIAISCPAVMFDSRHLIAATP